MNDRGPQKDIEQLTDDQLRGVGGGDGNTKTAHKVYKKGDRLWVVTCKAYLRPSRYVCTEATYSHYSDWDRNAQLWEDYFCTDFRCNLRGCIYRLPETAKTRGWDGTYSY